MQALGKVCSGASASTVPGSNSLVAGSCRRVLGLVKQWGPGGLRKCSCLPKGMAVFQ